jgi:signal transduction histidine kinase
MTLTGDVLVVDDSFQNTEVLSTLLSSRGHSVRVANGGHEALRLARQSPPDLVLLDVNMPDLDGFAVCRTLRETWGSAQMPVVFLSAAQDPINKLKAFESGAVDFVTKPFHFEEVLARVDTHLELKRRTMELERANQRLQQVEESRRRFITALVHDIKNPLTPMLKNTEWLLEQPFAEGEGEQAEVLRDLHVASNHLYRMVVSLLDVAKSGERALVAHKVRAPLRPWVDEALTLTRMQLRLQPERLAVTVSEGDAMFDPALLARVLQNLIDNALKYAPRAHPIQVTVTRGQQVLELIVEDRGTGVRAEDRERIFDAWTRLDDVGPLARSSHGIGLAFCRQAVEAHGGTIHVEDAQPHGARFVVRLPL